MLENKLTAKGVHALKPADKERTFSDGGGLWVRVLPRNKEGKEGSVNFYYRFELQGRERRFNCGSYPVYGHGSFTCTTSAASRQPWVKGNKKHPFKMADWRYLDIAR